MSPNNENKKSKKIKAVLDFETVVRLVDEEGKLVSDVAKEYGLEAADVKRIYSKKYRVKPKDPKEYIQKRMRQYGIDPLKPIVITNHGQKILQDPNVSKNLKNTLSIIEKDGPMTFTQLHIKLQEFGYKRIVYKWFKNLLNYNEVEYLN